MNFENYYLDLEKINNLSTEQEKNQIHRYYMDMMHSFSDNRYSVGKSIFNTLYQSGYLKELREEKLDQLLS
jgi:hypothetical protein